MAFPNVKISCSRWAEKRLYQIEWSSELYKYNNIFQEILRFNWFKESVIKNNFKENGI